MKCQEIYIGLMVEYTLGNWEVSVAPVNCSVVYNWINVLHFSVLCDW